MKATVVDLRYKMNDVLKALERNEKVQVLYHGKIKGVIVPHKEKAKKGLKDHPFFGMLREEKKSVPEIMKNLRRNRYNDI